ncbi:MAG: type II toxin-antitoxin system RelE/ParE family toxin [Clostridiales Family XIII bacterium]|jgi:phage-related protein|nr:type II toxin-antitoxin system RelE/ParE family toxin [Clostridiales Family XIII bacterium]
MNVIRLKVRFYRTQSGNEPVRDWLLTLEKHDKHAIGADIRTIQYRWPLGMPLVRKIEGNLWEVRSFVTNGISRVFFTVDSDQLILLHGIIKKSKKTPATDLQVAKARLAELRRL